MNIFFLEVFAVYWLFEVLAWEFLPKSRFCRSVYVHLLRSFLAAHCDFVSIFSGQCKIVGNLHSQPRFGVLPKALDRRIAISGLTVAQMSGPAETLKG